MNCNANACTTADAGDDAGRFALTTTAPCCRVTEYGLMRVSGEDAVTFLHGQFTNAVTGLADEVRNAGYCTPKGRLLATFRVWMDGDDVMMLVPKAVAPAFFKRLRMYVLRADVTFTCTGGDVVMTGVPAGAEAFLEAAGLPVPAPSRVVRHDGLVIVDAEPASKVEGFCAGGRRALIIAPKDDARFADASTDSALWWASEIAAGKTTVWPGSRELFVPQAVNYELSGGVVFNKGLLNIHYFYDLPVFRNNYMRIAFALCMAGILGYVFPEVLGGGNDLVNSLYTLPLSLKLFAGLLIGKFLFTLVSYGCGVPGGFFLPMLVLGALTGGITGIVFGRLGLISSYYLSNIVVISMAAFFAASVQSPVTGTILIMEMTSSYEHLLVLCTASLVALVVAQLCQGEPIYEALLQRNLAKNKPVLSSEERRNLLELTVSSGSQADGKYVGRIAWPAHTVIVDIKRGSGDIIPDDDTCLRAGDFIYVLTDSIEGAESIRNIVEKTKS